MIGDHIRQPRRWLLLLSISFIFYSSPLEANDGSIFSALCEALLAGVNTVTQFTWTKTQQETSDEAHLEQNWQDSKTQSTLLCAALVACGTLFILKSLYKFHGYHTRRIIPPQVRETSFWNRFFLWSQISSLGLEGYFNIKKPNIYFANTKGYLIALFLLNLIQGNWLKARYYFKNYLNLKPDLTITLTSLGEVSSSDIVCTYCQEVPCEQNKQQRYCTHCNNNCHELCLKSAILSQLSSEKSVHCPRCTQETLKCNIQKTPHWYTALLRAIFLIPPDEIGSKEDNFFEWFNKFAQQVNIRLKHPHPDKTIIDLTIE